MKQAKRVYVIGSGKGGVGKSTVSVNLAIAMAQKGALVGLLDADIYGPSIPIMLGLRRLSPRIREDGEGQERVLPFTKFGIKSMSIGYFMEEARSLVWRGPMLHAALHKMLNEVLWEDLDILFIDLPPGTGDVPISLAQLVQIDGALIVTTPQEVAMLDAIKAINSFDQLQIPLIGIIENMAGFHVPGTDDVYHIFGQGKAAELADKFNTRVLGSIPLIPAIRIGGDEGYPAAYHRGADQACDHFLQIADELSQVVRKKELHGSEI